MGLVLDWQLMKDLAIPLGAVVTWFTKDRILSALNIRNEKNNATGGNLENVQKALDLWQEMLDDAVKRHKAQVAELENIIGRLKLDYNELESMILEQKNIISEQKELIIKQSKSLEFYKKSYEKNKANG
jgi:ribosomal protein S21